MIANVTGYWVAYDINKNIIKAFESGEAYTNKLTLPTGTAYIRTYCHGGDLDSYYIVEGTVATPYEPYTESTSYLPNVGELRSLPNGTKDEIGVSDRKLIRKTNKKIPTSEWTQGTHTTNYYRFQNNGIASDGANIPAIEFAALEIGNKKMSYAYNNDDYEHFYVTTALVLFVPKTLIDAMSGSLVVEKWNNYISQNPITLTYQLAEEVVTPIQTSGSLISYPNGTVYIEPVTNVAGIYKDKISVLATELPIHSVDKISKIDFTTGNETLLDVSKAAIASDKLSFTHPNLTSGDIAFFEYYYPQDITTIGNMEVEYLDSRYTLKDSVTNKFYKWEISVADGVPSINLVEVL